MRVPLRILLSIAAAGAALWMTGVLEPIVGFPVVFPSFIGIVFVAANVAGTSWGLLTMALFGLGHSYFYLEPRGSLGLEEPHTIVLLVAYALAGVALASLGGALRNAYARLRAEHRIVTTIHEQREDLLKTLSHDVRTPLGVITTNATLLERAPDDAATVLRRARAIERSAASVADMLGDLVDAAHLESGHFQLERQPVELARFVGELRTRLDETLAVDRIRLAIPADLPAVEVDPHRFERILVNLLSNALKYSPAPASVLLGAATHGREVVISVSDSGPGIAPEDLPHLFEKYFRASGARTQEGLGLGLYSTRLLVQEHGGRVWVESEAGEGTTFHVALPIGGGPPLSAPRPAVRPGSPPPSARPRGTSPSGSAPRSSRGG